MGITSLNLLYAVSPPSPEIAGGPARLLRVQLEPLPMGENGVTLESIYYIGQTIAVVAILGTLVDRLIDSAQAQGA